MDAVYCRFSEELDYANALKDLVPKEGPRVSADLLCFSKSLIPYQWPAVQTRCDNSYRNFSPFGDLPNPLGEGEPAMDSPWRLRQNSLKGGTGDPSRWIGEYRKEHRDSVRKYQCLVPFHQVEFYEQDPATRSELYVRNPPWWAEAWVSQNMVLPLPPVVTFRARYLLNSSRGTAEGDFWWRVFETEWTAILFARWCTDIPQRGIMWYLPARARANIKLIGVAALLGTSPYRLADVQLWLQDFDAHNWSAGTQIYRVRGPTDTTPEVVDHIPEYVRLYNPGPDVVGRVQDSTRHASAPPVWIPVLPSPAPMEDRSVPPSLPAPLRSRPVSESLTPTGREPAELSHYDRDDFSRRAPRDPELPDTLRRRLEGVGHDTALQAYARARKYGSSEPIGYSLPITEDTLVEAFSDARAGREEAVAKVAELEKALRRAEIFAEMMKTQYLDLRAKYDTEKADREARSARDRGGLDYGGYGPPTSQGGSRY
jgi:hypothetical protein